MGLTGENENGERWSMRGDEMQAELNHQLSMGIYGRIQEEWDTHGRGSAEVHTRTAISYVDEKKGMEEMEGYPISLAEYMEFALINPENPVQLGIIWGCKYINPNFS